MAAPAAVSSWRTLIPSTSYKSTDLVSQQFPNQISILKQLAHNTAS